jgi:uncharacterized protein YciI
MLFMVAAYLKPGFERRLTKLSADLNEHFAQDGLRVAGALHDEQGHRRGYLGFVEADRFDSAVDFVRQGPFYQAQLYERIEVFEYKVQVGQLG